ncbi:hypothetical protein DM01DRAFT_1339508 [Hesseltinella vesiculosa]|uniref:Uncharacterized protein n=1 Tax=Hesseltinella vesiculosa TaxID=101127 RepID=A0A1X2G6Q2_9FUNG|nr:hypothetical protein DM01DRAFT_1339508 [Hesseltinella vesiculosa]
MSLNGNCGHEDADYEMGKPAVNQYCCSGYECRKGVCSMPSVLSGGSKKCIGLIRPKTQSACIAGTVSVSDIQGVGMFCYCGCDRVYQIWNQMRNCPFSPFGFDLGPQMGDGSGLVGDLVHTVGGLPVAGDVLGESGPFGQHTPYGQHGRGMTAQQCKQLGEAAKEACKQCSICTMTTSA